MKFIVESCMICSTIEISCLLEKIANRMWIL